MRHVRTAQDLYPALDELTAELKAAGESRLAAIIHHRVHEVAWTGRSELFAELHNVLAKALEPDQATLSQPLKEQVERVLHVIKNTLNGG